MKIYTKTGDTGETGYIGGRLSKSHLLFDVLGDLDEFNSTIGIIISKLFNSKDLKNLSKLLLKLQNNVFSIGAYFSGAKLSLNLDSETKILENQIDNWEHSLIPLKNFILPSGNELVSYIHFARSICRRIERKMVKFFENNKEDVNSGSFLKYINRLSDWLFVLARFAGKTTGAKEVLWIPTKP